ncbi:MAG: ECF transporter S component [Bacillota bacterium]|nr:ECF transporter S component [Bacillota bacterium]
MIGTRLLVTSALFAALITVGTLLPKIPGPTGYYHLGDGFIYTAAIVLGPGPAAAAGALGSALADYLGNAAHWAPWTLVIKGIAGYVVGAVALGKPSRRLVAMVLGAAITVVGYTIATAVIYDPRAALVETAGNIAQTAVGIIVALALIPAASRAFKTSR